MPPHSAQSSSKARLGTVSLGASYRDSEDSVDSVGAAPARTHIRWDAVAVVLLALGAILRLWLAMRGWPQLDSDEAIIGLMARHILYNGEHPIFFYGQHYNGALEAYVVAGFFWVMGPTTLAMRGAMLVFVLPFLVCVYLLGKVAYGRTVAILSLAYLTFGPSYGLMRELPGISGYQETLLFGALLPLLAYYRLRQPQKTPQQKGAWIACLTQYMLIGLVIGLGIWSDELILPFVAATLAALLIARTREIIGWSGGLLGIGALIGGAPFVVYNLLHHGQTFIEVAQLEQAPTYGVLSRVHTLLLQTMGAFTIGVPTIFGSPHVCVAPGTVYAGYASYPAAAVQQSATPLCNGANLGFGLVILALYVFAAWSLFRAPTVRMALHSIVERLRRMPHARSTRSSEPIDSAHTAQLWVRAMLVFCALALIAEYSLSQRSVGADEFVAVRYLLPILITVPVLIGSLTEGLSILTERIATAPELNLFAPARWLSYLRAFAPALMLTTLFAFVALGCAETMVTAANSMAYAQPIAPADARLLQEFRSLGVTSYYGYYWVCYTIVFESDEQIHCSSYGRPERYPPYATQLQHAVAPAYVLLAGSADASAFQRRMSNHLYHEGYRRIVFEGYDIYYKPQ